MLVNSRRLKQLDVVTEDVYEVEMSKRVIKYYLPMEIGFFVYQYAKLRMLQFYYDFIDTYVDRPLFQYCETDTDSAYIAIAGENVDELVSADKREHYFRHRVEWFTSECCDDHVDAYVRCRLNDQQWIPTTAVSRVKREWQGDGFIGLSSKTYYCFGGVDKFSTKGLNKTRNEINKDKFMQVLTSRVSGTGLNRGFQVKNSSMYTYIQERAALTYFYPKLIVMDDGVTTGPLFI